MSDSGSIQDKPVEEVDWEEEQIRQLVMPEPSRFTNIWDEGITEENDGGGEVVQLGGWLTGVVMEV